MTQMDGWMEVTFYFIRRYYNDDYASTLWER